MDNNEIEKSQDSINVVDEAYQLQKRDLKGTWKLITELLAISLPLLYIYTSAFGLISIQLHRSFFIGVCLALAFLYNPFNKNKYSKNKPSLIDIFLVLLSFAFVIYFVYNYPLMAFKAGLPPTTIDLVFGSIAVILCIEGSRRVLGNALPIVTIVFILYTLYGNSTFIPQIIRHSGVSFSRFMYYQYNTIEGIFGSVASVCATYVLMFIFLGAFLEKTGAGDFFINLSLALTGRTVGGPAKTAVIASGFFGSLSGSAVANTVATGTFTIPLMKKAGYKPEVAGAIEPVASTGGQFMPPVMGAGAFLMVEFTGIPYIQIIKVGLIPALLYFTSVFIMVHLEAKKTGIGSGHLSSNLPNAYSVLKEGWYFLLIILLVVFLLVRGISPQFAAFWAILATILTKVINVLLKKESKSGFLNDLHQALIAAGKNAIVIGTSVGVIGVIVGCIFLTGIGIRFSSIIIGLSSGILPLAMIFIALAATVIGMGATVTSSYIIVSVLAIPALSKLGVPLLAAHFIVFWFSQTSNITPPVCVAAFAGASIAHSSPMKTGFNALKYGSILYVMPFLFVYSPGILLEGSAANVILTVITSFIAMLAFSGFIMGYLYRKTTLIERILLLAASLLLLKSGIYTDIFGILFITIVILAQKYFKKTYNKERE
jgi:TRAP transporter 4TM/12TM fusion protein